MAEEPAGIHRLVLLHGREVARSMVPREKQPLVDIAAEVLADESQTIGISYTGFYLTSLPHKRLADDQAWEKKGHRVSLLVEPGRLKVRGKTTLYGVPYGARARMILLYLQTQAVRTTSREIELGRSMRAWLERMGITYGGETAKALREQATRISACSLKFFWEDEAKGGDGWSAGRIVNSGLSFHTDTSAEGQENLWDDRIQIDDTFYQASMQRELLTLMRSVFGESMLRAVIKDSAEIDNASGRLMTVYELDQPVTSRETYQRCMTYLNAANAEIETQIRLTWPSQVEKLRSEGVI